MSSISSSMGTFEKFTVPQLSEKCQDKKEDKSHEPYCFELFVRAIVNADNQAWSAVYGQYQKLMRSWVIKAGCPDGGIGGLQIDDFVINAFVAFWKAFDAEKIKAATGLPSVLAYMKACAVTAVGQAHRKSEKSIKTIAWEDLHIANAEQRQHDTSDHILLEIDAVLVWREIEKCCTDESDMLIARLGIASNLKPKKILELHPGRFKNVKEIYDRRRNLRDRLQRNETIRQLLGIS